MKPFGIVAALVLMCLFTPPAVAEEGDLRPEERRENFVTELGYTYHNGLWYKDSIPYTRSFEWYTAYRDGCYSCPYRTWRAIYTRYTPPTYTAPTVPALKYSKDWRTAGLNLLTQREDLNAFSNFVKENNLGGGFAIADKYPYGAAPGYGGAGAYGISGTTVYARGNYTQGSQQAYNSSDRNLTIMLATRLLQNGQVLNGQGMSDLMTVISQEVERDTILGKAQAIANLQGTPALQATTFQFTNGVEGISPQAGPTQINPVPTMPKADGGASQALSSVWQNRCASCHTGAQAKAGFTLDKYLTLNRQAKIEGVWSRLTSADPKKLMPRDASGVGHRLPDNELQAFFVDISGSK